MENSEKPEEDVLMDFESGIDTWIIDKDESVGSFSCFDKLKKEGKEEKSMNKENIKHSVPPSDSKSLRSFRIRKRVSYQEFSSESESESNKIVDEENYVFCNKRRSDLSTFSKAYTPLSTSKEIKRDIESLSSEEISSMLSEIDDSKDSSPGSNREKLHSIENVTSTSIDSKIDSQSSSEVKCGKCCKISECCNCGLSETKLIYESPKNKYQNSVERNKYIENVSSPAINKSRDAISTLSENKPKVNCTRCHKTLEYCNCDFTKVESADKGRNHKFKQLFKRNGLSNRGIPQAGVNGKIISINESGLPTKLVKPVSTDRPNQILKCGVCGYLAAELLIYKSHQILFHSESNELECEYCDFKTNFCASLATHIRVHFRMDCPYCDYHCSLKTSLTTHLLRYHQNAHPYSCKACDYSCKSQSKFYDHLQMHAVKKYQCGECKMFFSNKPTLKAHIKKHVMKANVFKCGQCDLQFSHKQSLKLHMKRHTKESVTYLCSSCKISFTRKCDFISHSKTHSTAPKTLKCEKCESTFSQSNHLKLHMRVHSIKLSKCKFCSFQFSDSSEIKNHMCVSVNKLYDVQKRSLNFEGVVNDFRGNNTKVSTNVKEELPLKKVSKNVKIISTKNLPRPSESKVLNSKSNDLNKRKKAKPKVLALRQNLRSFKAESKNERKNGKLKSKFKYPEERRGRAKKPTDDNEIHTRIRRNGDFHDSSSITRTDSSTKRQRRIVKKVRKDQLSKGLEVIKDLFCKKPTLKDMLVEPIMFANSSFIECFYQSQQPSSAATLQQHEERHLRRPSLLSCRYCNYKTNSQQLLKWHVDKNHTWDPVVVSKLFRP